MQYTYSEIANESANQLRRADLTTNLKVFLSLLQCSALKELIMRFVSDTLAVSLCQKETEIFILLKLRARKVPEFELF